MVKHKPGKFAWREGAKVSNQVSFHEKMSPPVTQANGKRRDSLQTPGTRVQHPGTLVFKPHSVEPGGVFSFFFLLLLLFFLSFLLCFCFCMFFV